MECAPGERDLGDVREAGHGAVLERLEEKAVLVVRGPQASLVCRGRRAVLALLVLADLQGDDLGRVVGGRGRK